MAFVAECPFCVLKLQKVPDHRLGDSIECPRCHNRFTLTALINPKFRTATTQAASGTPGRPAPAVVRPPAAPPPVVGAGTVPGLSLISTEHAAATADTFTHEAAAVPSEAPVPATAPELQSVPAPAIPRPPLNVPGVVSFLLGSLALCSALLFHAYAACLVMSALGIVLALAGLGATLLARTGVHFPVTGFIVSGAVFLLAIFSPGRIGLPPRSAGIVDDGKQAIVPLGNKGMQPFQPAEETAWTDASREFVQQGDVRVRITSVSLKAPGSGDQKGKKLSQEKYLFITLRLNNVGVARRVEYASWGEPGENTARLSDTGAKTYRLRAPSGNLTVAGHVRSASLAPGKYVEDVLVFETPAADVQSLRLELPAQACGMSGVFRFRIPTSMISKL